jgi:DnaK suppressor protein
MASSSLSRVQLRDLERVLLAERKRLIESRHQLQHATQELGEGQIEETAPGGELADIATEATEQEIELTLERAEEGRLLAVEAALRRLHEGDYGRCERCGQEISLDRLVAIPWTTTCVRCASLTGGKSGARSSLA